MLLSHPRHSPADLATWAAAERLDAVAALQPRLARRTEHAARSLREFVTAHPRCYAGVSWGKDSTVLADLIQCETPHVPLVWIRVEPVTNPDCTRVRDEFLHRHPAARYEEVTVWCRRDADGWHATGTLETGIAECKRRWGDAHLSGVRGEESRGRRIRMARWGPSSPNACAPIGHWTADDVFAYLHRRGLPVHPVYAMTRGGLLDRRRIRVSDLGGHFGGSGHGRDDWERHYYGDRLDEVERLGPEVIPTGALQTPASLPRAPVPVGRPKGQGD